MIYNDTMICKDSIMENINLRTFHIESWNKKYKNYEICIKYNEATKCNNNFKYDFKWYQKGSYYLEKYKDCQFVEKDDIRDTY